MGNEAGLKKIIQLLKETATKIRALEAEARTSLYDLQDEPAYREKLARKTDLLVALPSEVAPFLAGLDPRHRELVAQRVQRFSASAAKAKRVGSVFYMSALLYPEDYRDGEKNDLENFITDLEGLGE